MADLIQGEHLCPNLRNLGRDNPHNASGLPRCISSESTQVVAGVEKRSHGHALHLNVHTVTTNIPLLQKQGCHFGPSARSLATEP